MKKEVVVCVFHGQKQNAGEEVIAYQNGGLVFPQSVDGEKAASFGGVVHHVVVDEGSGVHEFHQCSTAVGLLGGWEAR